MSVVPIEREINRVKRQIDDLEWEGLPFEHLQRHLDELIEMWMAGETWYPNF